MYINPNIKATPNSMLMAARFLDWKIMLKREPSAKQLFKMAAGRFPKGAQYPNGKHLCRPGVI